jgi:hypothetical protein
MSVDGSFSTQSFTIHLTDIDEFFVSTPIVDMNSTANLLAENSPNGTLVGITANAFDLDGTRNTIIYSLDDSAGGRFAINSSTGVVTVADSSLLNYESAISHNIIIRATSEDLSYSTQSFNIHLTDADEFDVGSASDTDAIPNRVAENSAVGTIVGITALASDADRTTNTVSYSLSDSAGGRFAIDSTTGVVTVANSVLLDFETATNHSITVRSTSVDGSESITTFTISVLPVNEKPIALGESYQTDFTSSISLTNTALLANDTDPEGDSLQITILALPSQGGVVVSGNGIIYTPETNYAGTVTIVYAVSDGLLLSDPQTITIVITPPSTTAITAPVDRSASSSLNTEVSNTSGEIATVVGGETGIAINFDNPNDKQDASNVISSNIEGSLMDSRIIERREMENGSISQSHTESFRQDLGAMSESKTVQGPAIDRLQLDIIAQSEVGSTQLSFKQFIRPEMRESLEREKQQFFFQTATPIAFGTAIGAGISLHILATAQLGSSLLSQSGLFVPLDPLMVLEGSSKVKKSKEREDILFEVASLKRNGEK